MSDFHIKEVDIKKIKPYKKNPRKNDQAVKYVSQSIERYGFKQPIVTDKNLVIVVGHTRWKAAKDLGLSTVPVIIADDLSPEKIKEYRLADNRTSDFSKWNEALLSSELSELIDLDPELFRFDDLLNELSGSEAKLYDFESPLDEDKELMDSSYEEKEEESKEPEKSVKYYGDERERTFNAYNLYSYDSRNVAGFFDMPVIRATQHEPKDLVGFNYLLSSMEYNKGAHFFIDDYQFERLWASPEKYIDRIRAFDCCLTPDFSLYLDMPNAMKIWNTYRSRLLGQMMQKEGIEVIPTVSWADEDSFLYCFDGIEPGGTIAVSTVGVKTSETGLFLWKLGMKEAIKRIKPSTIVLYGGKVPFDFGGCKVLSFDNKVLDAWKGREKHEKEEKIQ